MVSWIGTLCGIFITEMAPTPTGAPGHQAGTCMDSTASLVFGSRGGLWFLSVALIAMLSGACGAKKPSQHVNLREVVSHPTNAACVLQAAGSGAAPSLVTHRSPSLTLYFKINLEMVPISNTHTVDNSNREKSHFYSCPSHLPVEPPPL